MSTPLTSNLVHHSPFEYSNKDVSVLRYFDGMQEANVGGQEAIVET